MPSLDVAHLEASSARLRSGLSQVRLARACALLLVLTAVSDDTRAQANAASPLYARVDPNIVQLEVVEGTDIRFSRLSQTRGISQTRVTSIVQDANGFLWFATQYGVNRYDGYSLKQFKHLDSDPRSVSDSNVGQLMIDHIGRLWVCSRRLVDRYDPVTESFAHYPLELAALSESAAALYHPNHVSEAPDGSLWVSTGAGLFRLDPATGTTTGFHHRADDRASLSGEFIESSAVDRRGTLWVASPQGLDALDQSTGRVTLHVPIQEPREMSFYEDRAGTFWVIHSSGHGLATLDRDTGVLTQYSFAERTPHPDELTGVSSMMEDADGQLWVGTQSDGLLRLDATRRRATRYRNDPFNTESLAENRITTLARDQEGEIWVGLGASEPNHFSPHPVAFHALPFDAGNRDNLGERLVNVLYEGHDGTLWLGTTGALNRYDRLGRRYERIPVPGRKSDVLAIVEEQPGVLWVGTSGQGLARLNLSRRASRLYRHSADVTSLSNDTVIHLLIDHSGTLWAATLDGLNRYDPAMDRFRSFRFGGKGFSVYTSVVEDAHHTLWLSGAEGVLHFDPATERFLDFKEGMAATGYSVLASSSGDIWAGTQTGLYRFNPATHARRVYTESQGLASSAISCLLEDAGGDIWMSTTEGVSRLQVASERFRNYSIQDGLPGRDLTGWNACSRSGSGELFFGGFAGAVAFDPRAVVDSPYTPAVALTGFELEGLPVPLGPRSFLQRALGYTRSLSLPSSVRTFALEFAALSFRSPSTNRYRYRLLGLESSWHEVGSERRVANYTTLPAGTYTFEVQGATNRGSWGEPGASLGITIEPPWWARWEFRALMGAAMLAVVFAIFRYRVQRVTRALEIRFDERVRERARIARDLHDSLLQGIQGLTLKFHAVARSLPPDSPARSNIENNLRQARELIDEVRTRVTDLRSQDEPRAALPELLQEFSASLPNTSATALQVTVVGKMRPLDPIAFQEVLLVGREAISNAMNHAGAGRIAVELTYTVKELTLKVSDDGQGVDSRTLAAGRAGHYGLKGMRERARALGSRLEIWSRPGAGTEIELVVPGAVAYDRRRAPEDKKPMRRLLEAIVGGRWPW